MLGYVDDKIFYSSHDLHDYYHKLNFTSSKYGSAFAPAHPSKSANLQISRPRLKPSQPALQAAHISPLESLGQLLAGPTLQHLNAVPKFYPNPSARRRKRVCQVKHRSTQDILPPLDRVDLLERQPRQHVLPAPAAHRHPAPSRGHRCLLLVLGSRGFLPAIPPRQTLPLTRVTSAAPPEPRPAAQFGSLPPLHPRRDPLQVNGPATPSELLPPLHLSRAPLRPPSCLGSFT